MPVRPTGMQVRKGSKKSFILFRTTILSSTTLIRGLAFLPAAPYFTPVKSLLFFFVGLFVLLGCESVLGQGGDSTRAYFMDARFHTGKILDNIPTSQSTVRPFMAELDLSIIKNEQRVWDYANCYAKNGLALSYIDFGDASLLGKAAGLSIFTEPHVVRSQRFLFTFRAGAGFSYLSKLYNADTNPDNVYFSQHISFLLLLNPTLYYVVHPRWRILGGVQFSHISNGGSTWPNWGINIVSANVGVSYAVRPLELRPRTRKPFTDRGLKVITHLFGGSHTSDPTRTEPSKKRFAGGVNVGVIKPLGRVCSMGVGTEFFYDGVSKLLEAQNNKPYNTFVASVSLQNYFFFGKILFGQQLAYYVTPHHPNPDSNLYQHYLLEYRIKGPWYAGISLHAHGKISDFMALTTGVIF